MYNHAKENETDLVFESSVTDVSIFVDPWPIYTAILHVTKAAIQHNKAKDGVKFHTAIFSKKDED